MTVAAYYRSRRVLVTGLTGFKGVWLGLWLRRLGAEVAGLALPPTGEMVEGWPGLERELPCVYGDIRDPKRVEQTFRTFQPEVVFHLAAQPLVRLSYEDPVATYASNVMGTVHVLEAARHTRSVQSVVVITTDKCYENREWHWGYREDDPLGGHDPYSASKACAEIATACYRQSFGQDGSAPRIASARAGNVVGGGDWACDRLIPDIVRAVLADRPVVLRRPTALRPWQHVLEPLSGYLLLGAALADRSAAASAWNFGPIDVEPLTVRDVAREIVATWGRGEIIEEASESGPHEAHYLKLDSSKAVAELGWRPLLDAAERFQWTVRWYQTWQNNPAAVWDFARQQIDAMEQRIGAAAPLARHWFAPRPQPGGVARPEAA